MNKKLLLPKLLIIVCLFTVQSLCGQTVSTENVNQSDKSTKDPFVNKWELSIGGGWSYLTAKQYSEVPEEFTEYINKLRSGYHLGAGLDYYWKERMAVGFRYSRFNTQVTKSPAVIVLTNDGTRSYGSFADNITVNFIGPSYTLRYVFPNRKIALQGSYAIGYLSYGNKSTVVDKNVELTGKTVGSLLDLGLSVPLGTKLSVYAGGSLLTGTLRSVTIEGQTSRQTIVLEDDQKENVSRIDLSAGLRFRL